MILNSRNGPLYFEVTGDGPAIVFVSGWAMSCECWRPVVRLLKRGFRCVIYDQRGIGRSQPVSPGARFTVEDHADDLHAILQATATFDAAFVAHEQGSLIATRCADRHPQDLNSLVIVSPRTGMQEDEIKRLAVYTPATLALRELAAFPLLRNVVAWRFRRAPQPYRDILFNDFADLNPRAGYETAISMADPVSVTEIERFLKQTGLPLLFASGEKDKKSEAEARRLFAFVERGKLALVKGTGFLPMLEYPVQFARLLYSFISSSTGAGRKRLLTR